MNPSHILIARNSRGPNNPLSSPTETHAAAAGIFRSAGTPSWYLEECESDDLDEDLTSDAGFDDPIDIDPTFTTNAKLPGTVKIVVESTTFWAHKSILYFASPFFEAALSGDWAETGRPQSMSSVITISQPPSIPGSSLGERRNSAPAPPMTFAPIDPDLDPADVDVDVGPRSDGSDNEASPITPEEKAKARESSLNKLQSAPILDRARNRESCRPQATVLRRRVRAEGPEAVIVLKEEKASTFHDFLKFVYPHLTCTISWMNAEGLMNIAHKLCVPALQKACLEWLCSHAAGRPIKALRIGELFAEEELYVEASRFVLDNPGGWSEHEMSTLSSETLLKLEKRRTWFLERVLKLGLTQIAKEYQCCPTCPDPPTCARMLEDKWRLAYSAVFRFGPCQPSMVFRYLRQMEGISPPLSLTHLNCQMHAKIFAATLFDRMFSLGIRGIGTDPAPVNTRVTAAAAPSTGPRRHFLYCSLKPEPAARGKRSREVS